MEPNLIQRKERRLSVLREMERMTHSNIGFNLLQDVLILALASSDSIIPQFLLVKNNFLKHGQLISRLHHSCTYRQCQVSKQG